jgi:hypothetical protein
LSSYSQSQREAALLLGQFATTDPEFKARIVQRGAVPPLLHMLATGDTALKEMATFALGRLAQNVDNQVCAGDGVGACWVLCGRVGSISSLLLGRHPRSVWLYNFAVCLCIAWRRRLQPLLGLMCFSRHMSKASA